METRLQSPRLIKSAQKSRAEMVLQSKQLESIVLSTRDRLHAIMLTFQEERQEFEGRMAMNMQEMRKEFDHKLADKQRIIVQLTEMISNLISHSKRMEQKYSKRELAYKQEIQTYKNLLHKKYLKEIDKETLQKRQTGPSINIKRVPTSGSNSPDSNSKPTVIQAKADRLARMPYISPETNDTTEDLYKPDAISFTRDEHDMQTRASTLAGRTSYLLQTLKQRTNSIKQSAFVRRKPEIDHSIKTANSTYVPSKLPPACEQNLSQL